MRVYKVQGVEKGIGRKGGGVEYQTRVMNHVAVINDNRCSSIPVVTVELWMNVRR